MDRVDKDLRDGLDKELLSIISQEKSRLKAGVSQCLVEKLSSPLYLLMQEISVFFKSIEKFWKSYSMAKCAKYVWWQFIRVHELMLVPESSNQENESAELFQMVRDRYRILEMYVAGFAGLGE